MSFLDAMILGLVQGLTEFLPVSSSGHLTVAQHFLGLLNENLAFDVAVHFGTLLSVLVVYRKVVLQLVTENLIYIRTRKVTSGVKLFGLMVIGSIPAAFAGIFFKKQFEDMFSSLNTVIFGFCVTGLIMFMTKFKARGQMGSHFVEKFEKAEKISFRDAIVVGLAQAMAITPGISRSGSTIGAGLFVGLDRSTAALFSFMLAIPAIFGAGLLHLRHVSSLSSHEMMIFLVGTVTSFLTGIVSLKIVLSFLKEGRLHYFSYYVWALALFLLFHTWL